MNLKFNFAKNYFFQSVGVLFLIVISICFANGQSKNIKNPTPLTSNEISGVIDKNTRDNTYYYYSFWANAGEVEISMSINLNPNFDSSSVTSGNFSLSNSNNEELANKIVSVFPVVAKKGNTTIKIQIKERQVLTLGIKIHGGISYDGIGTYKIQIKGADIKLNDTPSKEIVNAANAELASLLSGPNSNFPKNGYLVIAANGNGVSLNLSLVEEIKFYNLPSNEMNRNLSDLTYGDISIPKTGRVSIGLKDATLKIPSSFITFDLSQIKVFQINK